MREIGSNFCSVECTEKKLDVLLNNLRFSFSGRTSLLQVIDDIIEDRQASSACLPSYCCDSMIQPFVDRNFEKIDFYDVYLENNKIVIDLNTVTDADIIMTMNYFGMETKRTKECEGLIKAEHPTATIIKDITHSVFFDEKQGECAEYLFGSLRKWTGFADGAIAVKKNPWNLVQYTKDNTEHLNLVKKAQSQKKDYLINGNGEKSEYLDLFAKAEKLLEHEYEAYAMSNHSYDLMKNLDTVFIRRNRRKNFEILLSAKDIMLEKGIIPLFDRLEQEEVPLFFPVLLKDKEKRSIFRKYLISNNVFCPIHWPTSGLHKLNSRSLELYDRELSLVCDQRYTENEMRQIIKLIENFEE